MWTFYNQLIEEVPADIQIDFVHVGEVWTIVRAGDYCGMSATISEYGRSEKSYEYLIGADLKDTAALCRSWDFIDASVGTAALNAWLNSEEHVQTIGKISSANGFDDYETAAEGKKVAVIGHFYQLERFLTKAAEIAILEKNPQSGDYPAEACEFILPEADYTFITGSAFPNKTLPRLIELSRCPIILGPSAPMSKHLFEAGVQELSGFIPDLMDKEKAAALGCGHCRLSNYGQKICIKPTAG